MRIPPITLALRGALKYRLVLLRLIKDGPQVFEKNISVIIAQSQIAEHQTTTSSREVISEIAASVPQPHNSATQSLRVGVHTQLYDELVIADALARALLKLWALPRTCLRRSIIIRLLLSHYPCQLRIGVKRNTNNETSIEGDFLAHSWLEFANGYLYDPPEQHTVLSPLNHQGQEQ